MLRAEKEAPLLPVHEPGDATTVLGPGRTLLLLTKSNGYCYTQRVANGRCLWPNIVNQAYSSTDIINARRRTIIQSSIYWWSFAIDQWR